MLTTLKPTSTSPSPTFTNESTKNNKIEVRKYQHELSFNGTSSYKKSFKLNNHETPSSSLNEIDLKLIKSPWDILCKIINCKFAFKKQFEDKKYNWIQLAGHVGRFKPGDREGYILKLMDVNERNCFYNLRNDILIDFVPRIDNLIIDKEDGKLYTEMQDLLYGFNNPFIMDIKIGVRTFLEDDYMTENELKPRNDLYLRMIEVSPNEPNDYEHNIKAITKRRYMTWRENSTCSSTLGFRIEAIKKSHVSDKQFYTVKEKNDVKKHFKNFTDNNKNTLRKYHQRLNDLYFALNRSDFFKTHEVIGSSLLFVHDNKQVNIWMIDFGKTRELPENIKITHDNLWSDGNHEDGYLIGIKSLIDIFQTAIDD